MKTPLIVVCCIMLFGCNIQTRNEKPGPEVQRMHELENKLYERAKEERRNSKYYTPKTVYRNGQYIFVPE